MMSKTHIATGVAAVLLITQAKTPKECCLAVMGGALGGILPDIDCLDTDTTGDAKQGHFIALGIFAVCLLIDRFCRLGIWQEVSAEDRTVLIISVIIYVVLFIVGILCEHRGFTHSILALVIYTIPIAGICRSMTVYFAVGYFSHLLIDLLNKKKERLFFPFKGGICFKLCYADGLFSKVLMYVTSVLSVILIVFSVTSK